VAGVLEAKWELVEALGPAGIAVLPAGDERMLGRRDGPVLTFGEEPSADVVISDVRVGIDGRAACVLTYRGRGVPLHPVSAGLSQPLNLAAAAAAAVALGADFEAAAVRAAAAPASSWRMEVRPGSVTVVNDAYNANPDSTAAALETVAAMPGRHVAVLGRMHELGPEEAALHREVGERARRLGFDVVVVVGEDPGIADGAGHVARRAAGVDEALDLLAGLLEEGDVVLVKASRAEGLEALASRLEGANP
jgi:UDP-N-acetylmuramoyl-tripeptide--D-alanyl-D-alanine ligase